MPVIPREVIEHHLKNYPDARPIQQKSRKHFVERQNFIREQIKKPLDADFIREVHHPRWLANPVVVPKANVAGWGRVFVLQLWSDWSLLP
jgi:hypothetical protein